MKALAMAEVVKLTATAIMFGKGGVVTGIHGTKKQNEGIYHQLRRGHRFQYKNVAELRAYIQRAAEVIFHGTNIQVTDRKLKFKAGFDSYNLVREMFLKEFTATAPIHIDQQALPVKILTGTDRYNLGYASFGIGSAFLNGIGYVELEHEPSFDYDQWGDYLERGYSGGRSRRSWNLVMWDITESQYSNVFDKSVHPKGVTIDNRSKGNPNLYLVKPEGVPDIFYGDSNGFVFEAGQNYNRNQMGKEFTCGTHMAAWIPDKGRTVLIEKANTTNF